MMGSFHDAHGAQPSSSELSSWENSLPALARAIRPLRGVDLGIAVSTSETPALALERSRPAGVALEYHLPLSGRRVDVVLTVHERFRRLLRAAGRGTASDGGGAPLRKAHQD